MGHVGFEPIYLAIMSRLLLPIKLAARRLIVVGIETLASSPAPLSPQEEYQQMTGAVLTLQRLKSR